MYERKGLNKMLGRSENNGHFIISKGENKKMGRDEVLLQLDAGSSFRVLLNSPNNSTRQ